MEFIPYRMLRNNPSDFRKKLVEQGQLLVTVDGQPFAAMIDLSNQQDVEEIILLLSRFRAQMAARAIRSKARSDELDQLSEDEINRMVQETRLERTIE